MGNVFGVASNDTLSGADIECAIEGVYDLAKDNSTFSQGDLAYWDDSVKKVTSTVGSNLLIGAVEVAAATGASTVRVNLFGVRDSQGNRTVSRSRTRNTTSASMAEPLACRQSAIPSLTTQWCSRES